MTKMEIAILSVGLGWAAIKLFGFLYLVHCVMENSDKPEKSYKMGKVSIEVIYRFIKTADFFGRAWKKLKFFFNSGRF